MPSSADFQAAMDAVKSDTSLSPSEKMGYLQQIQAKQTEFSKSSSETGSTPSHSYLPEPKEPAGLDIGPSLGGAAQGVFQGLSGHIYNPVLKPEEQPAANTAKWVTDLGADIGLGLGGAAAGGTAGAALGSVVPGAGTALGAALGAPIGAGLAVAGHHGLINYQDQLHEHPGQPVNLGAVAADAGINGIMGAIAPGEGSLIKKTLLDAAIGGGGNAALNASDQYFNNNGHVDAGQVLDAAKGGALAGALLPLGMKGLGKVLGSAGRFLHGGESVTENGSVPDSANAPEPVKDPTTGLLKVPTSTDMPAAPPAGPGVLTGKVEYQTEAPEIAPTSKAPWDDGDDDGGGAPAAVLSPENGQPVQQPAEQPGNITSALEQLQQRRALLQQMQQQGQAMEARQQANQGAANPAPENVQAAQSAVEQLRARQQEIQRQQQEQVIQQKADEIHAKLTNYERLGAKSQANKLKAEIAEQAASHPDPIQRAAYQSALDKYAPAEKPTAQAPVIPEQPVEQPTVKLSGTVSKEGPANEPQGPISNPQGQASQPEGQQSTQGTPETQESGGQEQVESSGQEKVIKPPHTDVDTAKVNEMAKKAENLPPMAGVELPDGTTQLITGSHRYAALKQAGVPIEGHIYKIQPSDVSDYASLQQEAASTNDYNGLVDRLHAETNNPELKALLEDQTGKTDRAADGSLKGVKKGGATETEYVPTSDGNTDLGRLNPDHREQAGLKDVPVRMHEGNERYGAQKIRDKHNVENPADFVQNVLKKYNYAKFDRENNSLVVAIKNGKPQLAAVELVLDPSGEYYSVKTAGEFNKNYLKNKEPDWEAAQPASTDTKQPVSGVDESPAKLGETATERNDQSGVSNDSTPKKKIEPSVEEALNAIYPEKPYPKEGILSSTRPQGTDQREHLLQEQAYKAGKFLSPAEIENKEGFSEAYNKLTPDEQEKLHVIADAITNKKKLKTSFYNPGTETEGGVLTKRAGHGQELYTPKGLSITKNGDIVVHGYNENAELSSRRLDRFSGKVEKTTEEGYQGLYKHPSDINDSETFHPADAIVEQVANPILKKQVLGKPIVDSDYRQAFQTLRATVKEAVEANPETMTQDKVNEILERLPDKVTEYFRKNPCE